MANLFSTPEIIHARYDLKGSTQGRTTDPNENVTVARKDLDFNRENLRINLGLGKASLFVD